MDVQEEKTSLIRCSHIKRKMLKRYLSWQDIEDAVERLAINITNSEKEITGIMGLPRGGVIPATML